MNRALDDAPQEGTEYAGYLRIDDLLELQQPLTPEAHDELLFIIVHQSYELWFKLILHELGKAHEELDREAPAGGDPAAQAHGRDRAAAARPPRRARDDGPRGLPGVPRPAGAGLRLPVAAVPRDRVAQPAAVRAVRARSSPGDLAELYRDHLDDPVRALLYEVAELLIDHDEQIALWRHHHTLMAAREIGSRHGTGGSRGVEYLRSTQDKRFYPELWAVRAALCESTSARSCGSTRTISSSGAPLTR